MPIRPLNPELAEIACNKLNEDPEQMENHLTTIKEWISQQPHLRARQDDQFLATFLRFYKYDMNQVKQNLDLFYTCRGAAPEFYNLSHKSSLFMEIIETGCYLPLFEIGGPAAPRVCLIRLGAIDLSKYSLTDVFSAVHIIDKILMIDDDNSVIAGNINIIDTQGFDVFNLFQFNPQQMKKLLVCQQDALPLVANKNYYINVANEFNLVVFVYQNMLKPIIQNQMTICSETNDEIFESVPRHILPVEYGGTSGTLQDVIEHWKVKIQEYSDWLDEDEQYGTDESLRVRGALIADNMFGAQSSTNNFLDVLGTFLSRR